MTKMRGYDKICVKVAEDNARLRLYNKLCKEAVLADDYCSVADFESKIDIVRMEFFSFVLSVVSEVEED